MKKYTRVVATAVALSALTLAACTPPNENDSTEPKTEQTSAAAKVTKAPASTTSEVAFDNAYVKAKPAEKMMTGIFGTIVNNSDHEVTLNGFTLEIEGNKTQPSRTEMHEVVNGTMQMKPGGFVIPAGESHELKPGADHMMIMDYNEAIMPGTKVTLTLNTTDGEKITVKDVPVRELGAGEESYGADGSLQGHGADMSGEMSGQMSGSMPAGDEHDHSGHDDSGHNH